MIARLAATYGYLHGADSYGGLYSREETAAACCYLHGADS